MSPRVRDNIHFFNLLLTSHPAQRRALLTTASNQQLDFLSELFHNILFTLSLTSKQKSSLQRKKFVRELANIKRSYSYRRQRAKRHAARLLKILDDFMPQLRQVLDSQL